MRRRASLVAPLALGALAALAGGCPGGGGGDAAAVDSAAAAGGGSGATAAAVSSAAPEVGPDLSLVRPNQRWVFALDGGELEVVYTVRAVGPRHVAYDHQTVRVAGGERRPVGSPRHARWSWSPPAAGDPPVDRRARVQVVVVGGPSGPLALECVEGPSDDEQVLSRVTRGGLPTFPGEVEAWRDGRAVRSLVRVE